MTTLPTNLYESNKGVTNNVNVAFKLPKALKEEFTALCKSRNVEVSLVLRRFVESQVTDSKKSS